MGLTTAEWAVIERRHKDASLGLIDLNERDIDGFKAVYDTGSSPEDSGYHEHWIGLSIRRIVVVADSGLQPAIHGNEWYYRKEVSREDSSETLYYFAVPVGFVPFATE